MELVVKPHWEIFETPEGVGLRAISRNQAQAFEQIAVALSRNVAELPGGRGSYKRQLTLGADSGDDLLKIWLESLLKAMAEERVVFTSVLVAAHGKELDAVAWGEPVAAPPNNLTISSVKLRRIGGAWHAECVLGP